MPQNYAFLTLIAAVHLSVSNDFHSKTPRIAGMGIMAQILLGFTDLQALKSCRMTLQGMLTRPVYITGVRR